MGSNIGKYLNCDKWDELGYNMMDPECEYLGRKVKTDTEMNVQRIMNIINIPPISVQTISTGNLSGPASRQNPISSRQYPNGFRQDDTAAKHNPMSYQQYPMSSRQNPMLYKQYPVACRQNPMSYQQNPTPARQTDMRHRQMTIRYQKNTMEMGHLSSWDLQIRPNDLFRASDVFKTQDVREQIRLFNQILNDKIFNDHEKK